MRRRPLIGLAMTTAALAVGLVAPLATTQAQAPAPPVNDDYLASASLNAPRSALDRSHTLSDTRDTTSATVQPDIFTPGGPGGGPAEVTACGPTSYGKTVWYDFYPDVTGLVRLRANGFDTVISVISFDPKNGQPDFASRQCVNQSNSTNEELLAKVKKGGSYTVQIGGVDGAAGALEFLFDFLPDTDGDGVLDDVDKCRSLAGTTANAGCPPRLRASATLTARPTGNGIQIVGLSVNATKGATVQVRCNHGCRTQTKRSRGRVGFLRGRRLSAGTTVAIRVTRKGAIGAFVSYAVRKGSFHKVERCLLPGSRTPRRKCG